MFFPLLDWNRIYSAAEWYLSRSNKINVKYIVKGHSNGFDEDT